MEELLSNLDVVTVLVSFVLAFLLGWLWYSPKMFLKPWAAGHGIDTTGPKTGILKPMVAQAAGTLLLAVITNMAAQDGHVGHAVIVAVTVAFFIMSSNLYKNPKACVPARIEAGYILAMVAVMVAVNMVL
ncbi:MAG: DUF1761 family protein [Candidatus Kaiserbacteria bacterium]|nr:DUF1761 family protein [Candidatus Kaiserbacteria bacterium]MCB9815904.1 DUF1761 family protein [Candidatus Nomurabacteria bacterium]